jgi:hypothetical protein
MTAWPSTAARPRNPWIFRLLLVLLVVGFAVALTWRAGVAQAGKKYDVPENPSIESKLGIRFTQAAVVADGGLIEVRYTVLDADKATTFQNDVHHPPVLRSPKRTKNALYRTALMKQGHNLRPGQTYYILYLNNHGAVRSGETLNIDAGGGRLANVPVR